MTPWRPELPSLSICLWLAPALVLGTLAAGELAARLRGRGMRTGDTRKVFHFLVFTAAALVGAALGTRGVNLLGGIVFARVVLAAARGEGAGLHEALARETDRPRRTLHVIVPLLATAAALALLGVEPAAIPARAAAVAAVATATEAVSPHGLDNLTIQIAAAGVAAALL